MITESSFSGSLSQRIRRRYFYSPMASLFTVVVSAVIAFIVGKLVLWGLVNAVWTPDVQACGQSSGACWGFVAEKWRLIIFGRYPYHLQWRAAAATGIVLAMLVVSSFPFMWRKPYLRTLGMLWSAAVVFFFILMLGGVFGLESISTDMWGGLPLTIVLTLVGMGASVPLGILLALGRRSKMPAVASVSTGYIELVRGVPLITVLFVAAFIFPLLLPAGVRIDPFWRISVAIALFQAAYMAEIVRGGLQTIPRGRLARPFPATGLYGGDPAAGARGHHSGLRQQPALVLHGHVSGDGRLDVRPDGQPAPRSGRRALARLLH